MNKKGIALILAFFVIMVLTVLGTVIFSRGINEARIAKKYSESTQAFWVAEAGVNRALKELKSSYAATGLGVWSDTLGQGKYSVDVRNFPDGCSGVDCKKDVTVSAIIPATASSGNERVKRIVEAIISKEIPAGFFDNAIYSAGDVDLNGNSYSITGQVRYADSIDNTGNINGAIVHDPSISPLALLDFGQLLSKSQTQENVYAYVGNKLKNTVTGSEAFPPSFWYSRADDSIDNDGDSSIDESDEWVPNIVYVNGDLELNGNIGTIGGFFVVVGDVINTPDVTQEAIINGNGMIEGIIYTRGEFRVNGGGGNLNINGGIWAGEEARVNGNANISYNLNYMDTIKDLDIAGAAQIISWKDLDNPYKLTP